MLQIESLTATAGSFRLRDVHLTVAEGECHALLGPSGAGKSTLLNAVLGLVTPESGRIRLAGRDIIGLPIERRELGYLPQQIALFPHLSVRENLLYGVRARRRPPREFEPLLHQLVTATGLEMLLDRRPDTLSGGERQRVGLVRALMNRPRLVLLDEPFAALNESLKRELWWLLRDLIREWRLTVLIVTHDLAEAYFLADRVTVLLDGRVVQQGDKADVYLRPVDPQVARFLGVETLQPGRIVEVRDGLAKVQVGSAQLTALASPELAGDVLVSIRGEDVILEREDAVQGSARNRLPSRVLSVQPGNPLLAVQLDAGFPLLACITRPAYEELTLRPGSSITAVIKATAVHLIPSPHEIGGGPSRAASAAEAAQKLQVMANSNNMKSW
ncbi:MAG: ABC transporter ATP-binding protein [Thermogutta sp.]